jgi:hypothetical protein
MNTRGVFATTQAVLNEAAHEMAHPAELGLSIEFRNSLVECPPNSAHVGLGVSFIRYVPLKRAPPVTTRLLAVLGHKTINDTKCRLCA